MTRAQRPRALALLLSALAPFLAGGKAAAADDLKKPYRLNIVLHVARHPLLTDVFRQQIGRELRDSLQVALGELGRVEVVPKHPLLERVVARGLDQGLQGWQQRSDAKTQFVLIDYVGGYYEIRTRQYDGVVGQPSPVVREDRTRDRSFVAKAAALMVKHDFGLVGTVVGNPSDPRRQGEVLKVELRGGGLDVPLSRWVQKGEVFALVQAPPDKPTYKLDWTLLQVQETPDDKARDGVCVCRLFHRYTMPRTDGLRCIKLGTTRAPLRMRLMEERPDRSKVPLEGPRSVEVRRHGFTDERSTLLQPVVDKSGYVDTSRKGNQGLFDNVAFVSVYSGSDVQANVPVALVADRLVVVGVSAVKDANALLAVHTLNWKQGVVDSLFVQDNLFKELQQASDKPDKRAAVLKMARDGLERAKEDRKSLTDARKELLEEAKPVLGQNLGDPALADKLNLGDADRRLKSLEEGESTLARFIAAQEKIEKEENDPQRKKWRSQVEEGRLLEREAEVGKAISLYKKILADGFKSESLPGHVAELEKLWTPKSEKHAQARDFIYLEWPKLDNQGLKDHMKEAENAVKACKDERDLIGLLKFFKATDAHLIRMSKELSNLKPEINIDDEKPAKLIKELATQLTPLVRDVKKYLDHPPPEKK